MIVTLYNPKLKQKTIESGGFELANKNSNRKRAIDLIYLVTKKYIGLEFEASLEFNDLWFYKTLHKPNANASFLYIERMKDYLNKVKWHKKKYSGAFLLKNLKAFLNVFIDYSFKFNYHPVELYSTKSDFVIVISDHGTIWFVSKHKKTLKTIAKVLDRNGATVIFSNTF